MTELQDVQELERLLEEVKHHHTKLYNDNVKKSCVECRRHLQSMAVLCKSMRKACLEHKNTIPTIKRTAKVAAKAIEAKEKSPVVV